MAEIDSIVGLVERFGVWIVFLYLYLRESNLRQQCIDSHLTAISAQMADMISRLNAHIDRTV